MNRRDVLGLGILGAVATSADAFAVSGAWPRAESRYAPACALLDRYVAQYLRDMNAPGLTLSLADASGLQYFRAYGVEQLEPRIPLNADRLFHIGSITK